MLNNENFKNLVYQKAAKEKARIKKRRITVINSVAALCVCVIIGGIFIYSNLGDRFFLSENENNIDPSVLANESYSAAKGYYFSGKSYSETPEDGYGYVLADCAEVETQSAIRGFSYADDMHELNIMYESTDKHEIADEEDLASFHVDDILVIAKANCTIEYNSINLFYDDITEIWKIVFYVDGDTLGGCQSIYISGDGTVLNTIYGE